MKWERIFVNSHWLFYHIKSLSFPTLHFSPQSAETILLGQPIV